MNNSSSYRINTINHSDDVCFRSLITVNYTDKQWIVIEENKKHFSDKLIKEYLEDLKKMGYAFSYTMDEKEILINTSEIKDKVNRIAFFMVIRFLWEGKYLVNIYNNDVFTDVIEHYFRLKKMLPKEENLFKILCIACNCFIIAGYSYNLNHFFSNSYGCNINKSIKITGTNSVNNYFAKNYFTNGEYDSKLQKVKNWKEDDYNKVFKKIEYETII